MQIEIHIEIEGSLPKQLRVVYVICHHFREDRA